jgi:hypothetical protein
MRLSQLLTGAATAMIAVSVAMTAQAQQAHTVFFALGSAQLDAEANRTLDRAAAEHRQSGSTSVSIVGHTDTTGSPSYNQRLSQRRAEAVAGALSTRGVPRSAMTLAWRGETELAVQTGDNVAERRNRRAEVAFGGAAAPAAAPMMAPSLSRFTVGIGPYGMLNLQEDDESFGLGGNLFVSYALTPSIALSAEQAVYWNFDAEDEGVGARSVVGLDWTFADFSGVKPYVGANAGYTWIDGSGTGGFTYGPEIGVNMGRWGAKLAYDFLEDRDAEEGIISLTVGYLFNF